MNTDYLVEIELHGSLSWYAIARFDGENYVPIHEENLGEYKFIRAIGKVEDFIEFIQDNIYDMTLNDVLYFTDNYERRLVK
ncbi:hypothetical protein [Bacillus smithii]|uniref:hypothetical protein n=1 Tax=Bacillus smithii TaxID=1479 RepID=UPI003D1B33E3